MPAGRELLLLALFLQQGRGLSPIESGGVFSVLAAGYLITSFPAPKLSVSGALATAQQVGNAIGVAVSGVVFYGLLSQGYGIAYRWSVAEMAALLLGVTALTFLIPKPQSSPGG